MNQDVRVGREMFEFAQLQLNEISTNESLSREVVFRNLISRVYYSVFWIARGQILQLSNVDLIYETQQVHQKVKEKVGERFGQEVEAKFGDLFDRRVIADYQRENVNYADANFSISEAESIISSILS